MKGLRARVLELEEENAGLRRGLEAAAEAVAEMEGIVRALQERLRTYGDRTFEN